MTMRLFVVIISQAFYLILKTIGSFKISILRVLGVDENEVVGGGTQWIDGPG